MIRFKEYLERRARRAAFMSVCLAGLAGFGGLFLTSCANEDLGKDNDKNGGDKGAAVSFNVSEAQNDAQAAFAKTMPGVPVTRAAFTEQLGMMNLTPKDLTTQKLTAEGAAGADLCLIETTTPGVIPTQQGSNAHDTQTATATAGTEETTAATRANITTLKYLGHFSSYGYRGTTATSFSTTPNWFYNKDTNPDGTLVDPVYWSWTSHHFGKFYAVSPLVTAGYTKLTVSPETYASTPYVDFEVEPNVTDQKDLMTAFSGVVEYASFGVPPTTNLKFHHALTAVRFAVGQNLSWDKTIDKVEIRGAVSKGRYTMATDADGTDAAWNPDYTSTGTFSLACSVNTKANPNVIIVGKPGDNSTTPGDNYTFYMIPQTLTGKGVKAYVHFTDGTEISVTLTGSWKPGTTKTYKISNTNSNWQYTLNVTPTLGPVPYNQTDAGWYSVQSYRQAPDGTQQAVAWKVVGYQESTDGGTTWSPLSDTKPEWLDELPVKEGNGTTWSESGIATIQTSFIDKLVAYNKVLHDANAKGTASSYYDLSTHDYKGNPTARNTANSYLISAPGYYKIPLVYGNAIKNGHDNPDSYTGPSAPVMYYGTDVNLYHFKDHNDQDITDPWITQTNGGVNAPDDAKIVWTDQSGIVEASSLGIEGSGTNAFVHFRVPQDKIKNGNAVIAVTKGGTVVWSWHLWFAKSEELNTIPMVNYQNKTYSFTQQTLGLVYYRWEVSTCSKTRAVRIKVEQTIPNGSPAVKQSGTITITQTPGRDEKKFGSTLYQWGRKDATPSTDAIADGSYSFDGTPGGRSIGYAIQHPGQMFINAQTNPHYYDWCNATYFNLWSAKNTEVSNWWNDNTVVKTIYDPCPAGLKMPASNAFSGFTTTGQGTYTPSEFNVEGSFDEGWTFRSHSGTNTIFIPASGFRAYSYGLLSAVGYYGYYWSAVPCSSLDYSCYLDFEPNKVNPIHDSTRSHAFAVRPVAE